MTVAAKWPAEWNRATREERELRKPSTDKHKAETMRKIVRH